MCHHLNHVLSVFKLSGWPHGNTEWNYSSLITNEKLFCKLRNDWMVSSLNFPWVKTEEIELSCETLKGLQTQRVRNKTSSFILTLPNLWLCVGDSCGILWWFQNFIHVNRFALNFCSTQVPEVHSQHSSRGTFPSMHCTPDLSIFTLSDSITPGGEMCVFNSRIIASCGAERGEIVENRMAEKGTTGGLTWGGNICVLCSRSLSTVSNSSIEFVSVCVHLSLNLLWVCGVFKLKSFDVDLIPVHISLACVLTEVLC